MDDTDEAAARLSGVHLSAAGPTSHGTPRRPADFAVPRRMGYTDVYSPHSELYDAPDILPNSESIPVDIYTDFITLLQNSLWRCNDTITMILIWSYISQISPIFFSKCYNQ